MITDAKGAVYQHLEYFPFGETWIDEGKTPTNIPGYQFTGKELDPETGLYYFGARYYEPVISKWISADPILGKYLPTGDKKKDKKLPAGGVFDPGNLSLYVYAGDNPVKLIDPDGQAKGDWWDARTYFAVGHSSSVLTKGVTISDGVEQKTRNLDVVGGSLDVQIGFLPTSEDTTVELSVGLGKHGGVGVFFGRPDSNGEMEVGGVALHFGAGLGSPVDVTVTQPAETTNVTIQPPSFPKDAEFRNSPISSTSAKRIVPPRPTPTSPMPMIPCH